VDVLDTIAARINQSSLGGLLLITLPANAQPALLTAAEPIVMASISHAVTDMPETFVAPAITAHTTASLVEPLVTTQESIEDLVMPTESPILQSDSQVASAVILLNKLETETVESTETLIKLDGRANSLPEATVVSQRVPDFKPAFSVPSFVKQTTTKKRSIDALNRLRDKEFHLLNSNKPVLRRPIAATSPRRLTNQKPVSDASEMLVDEVFAAMGSELAVLFNPLHPDQPF
jgi:hypothetical protein